MWIRSQNKLVLGKINEIWIEPIGGEFSILGTNSTVSTKGGLNLGEYKTKEKAIEELDYIENLLHNNFEGVHQMPKK